MTDEYLSRAIDLFHTSGILLAVAVWRDLAPGEERDSVLEVMDARLMHESYNNLVAERWLVAEHLSRWIETSVSASASTRMRAVFNRLQAQRWQYGLEHVHDELTGMDISALSPLYTLAHAALLEDEDRFFHTLPIALVAKELSPEDARDWPIFRTMRTNRRRFSRAIATYTKTQTPAAPPARPRARRRRTQPA